MKEISSGAAEFETSVVAYVLQIPYGKVASYGQIAALVGAPRSARQVGKALSGLGSKVQLPWWRVLNSQGKITISGGIINQAEVQKKMLQAEGVEVSERFRVDMKKYRWNPQSKQPERLDVI
jgi:methylated-DNA-protein-cysteine methyltransferase-like protein